MIITRLVLITLPFLFFGCDSKNKNELSKVLINPSLGETIALSELVDSFEIFQPNSNAVVAYISDFIVLQDKVIILDNQIKKEIQVFNLSGESLLTIQASGDGPGEFRSPSIFRVSSSGDELILYCSGTKKFLFFNWKGDFIKEVFIKEIGLIGDFLEKDGEIIFLNVMTVDKSKRLGKLNLNSYSKDKKLIFFENYPGDFFKIKADKNRYFFEIQDSDYFYFKDIYSSTIVKMDWEGKYTIDKLEIVSKPLSLDVNKIYEPSELSDLALKTDAFILGEDISHNKSDFMVDIYQGETSFGTVLLDRQSQTIRVISLFENDMDGLFPFTSFTSFGSQKAGIITMNFDHDMVYNRLNEIDLDNRPFRKKLEKLNSPKNENPVIFIYYLKAM